MCTEVYDEFAMVRAEEVVGEVGEEGVFGVGIGGRGVGLGEDFLLKDDR